MSIDSVNGKGILETLFTANILGAPHLLCPFSFSLLSVWEIIWPFFPIIAILMWMFLKIKKHYNGVAQQLRIDGAVEEHHYQGNIVLIPGMLPG